MVAVLKKGGYNLGKPVRLAEVLLKRKPRPPEVINDSAQQRFGLLRTYVAYLENIGPEARKQDFAGDFLYGQIIGGIVDSIGKMDGTDPEARRLLNRIIQLSPDYAITQAAERVLSVSK